MSRCTQYIGLNNHAEHFLDSNNAKMLCRYQGDTGMFEEPLFYGIYEVEIKYMDRSFSFPDENENETNVFENVEIQTFAEITQCAPWRSGPCYYTCLKNIKTGQLVGEWAEDK
jgi:hypothetical protein